jgi:hypothetical protein
MLICKTDTGCIFAIYPETKTILWDIEGYKINGEYVEGKSYYKNEKGEWEEVKTITGINYKHPNGNSCFTPPLTKYHVMECSEPKLLECLFNI